MWRKIINFKKRYLFGVGFLIIVGLCLGAFFHYRSQIKVNSNNYADSQKAKQKSSIINQSSIVKNQVPTPSFSVSQQTGNKPAFAKAGVVPQSIATPRKVTEIPILYYHSIMVEPGNELRIPPEQFNVQMMYLSNHGYNVLTPDELYSVLYGNGSLPKKPILITFDDGYEDNYTNAFPILKKFNFPATVFMVSSFVNGNGFLTTEQLKELQSAGWTIGGHTVNHIDLSKVDSNTAKNELVESKRTLENLLGAQLKYFCYPFGGYNSKIVLQVKQSGYLMAFTTQHGWVSKTSDPYLLHRVYCYANMGMQEFIRRITNPNY